MVTFGYISYAPSEKQKRFKERLEIHHKIIADLCEAGDFEEAIKTSLRRPAYDGDNEKIGKKLESRLKKEQILLSHEFLNAQIFHSSVDCRQKTYLIHMLRKTSSVPLSLVKAILAVPGFNPNKADSYGTTPLMIAICKDLFDIMKELLAHPQIDVNKPTYFRRPSEMRLPKTPESPLMIASSSCNLDAVKLLLAHPDIDVNWRNGAGQTALTIAYDVTIDTFTADTWFHNCEKCGEFNREYSQLKAHNLHREKEFEERKIPAKAIMALLEARPEIHGPLHYRNTFHLNNGEPAPALVGDYGGIKYTHGYELFTAVKVRDNKRVSELLSLETIDVNFDNTYEYEITKKMEEKYMEAKRKGMSGEMLELFEPRRPAVNAFLDKPNFGKSPLTLAVEIRNYYALRNLLAHPRLDVNRTDFSLYYAYFAENVAPVFDEQNALLIAALNNDDKAFDMLLEHKDINVNKLFPWRRMTTFMECVEHGYNKLAEKLLARSELDLNVRNKDTEDALCIAARNGVLSIVERLVRDSRQKQSLAHKALRFAFDGQHLDICLKILEWLYPTPSMFHRAKTLDYLKISKESSSVYQLFDNYIVMKFSHKMKSHLRVVKAIIAYTEYEKSLESRIRQYLAFHPLKPRRKKTEAILKKFAEMKAEGVRPSIEEVMRLIPEIQSGVGASGHIIAEFLSLALFKRYEIMEERFLLWSKNS